jgi:hypothetical protein
VCEERVESDAEALSTASDAESVEGDDEEGGCVALETACQHGQDREYYAADDFERGCDGYVGEKESFHVVHAVVVVAIENISFHRIGSDVVEHFGMVKKVV